MKYYIYRNYTIEYLFQGIRADFSSYNEVSFPKGEYNCYIFFYFTDNTIANIVDIYEKINYLIDTIPNNKLFYIFSLEDLYNFNLIDSDFSYTNELNKLNKHIYKLSQNKTNVRVINFKEFCLNYSKNELIDWKFYYTYEALINPKLYKDFSKWFNKKIDNFNFMRKKCLILDLDNTLWGGIIGEDSIEKISLGGSYPGNVYIEFQKLILNLKDSGIILCICSKNNFSDVESFFDNSSMILSMDDFIIEKINWNDKDINIREIANELKLGVDSFVFIDDSPFERELIKTSIPEIIVPDFPKEEFEIVPFFKDVFKEYFSTYELSNEDKNKSNQYKIMSREIELKKIVPDYNDFIRNLEISIKIDSLNDFNISRIIQLLQKTNQFNLTNKRYTFLDIKNLEKSGSLFFCAQISDKFEDKGITTLAIVNIFEDYAEIDSFLMSCRVLSRGIENVFLTYILNELYKLGYTKVYSNYIKSEKNIQTLKFYESNNFSLLTKSEKQKTYEITLDSLIEIDNKYKLWRINER